MYEWNAKCEYILTADIDGKHHRMISKRDSKKHKAIRDKGGVKNVSHQHLRTNSSLFYITINIKRNILFVWESW
jgi:hypothetical protein